MISWLATLPMHHYGEQRPDELAWHLNQAKRNIIEDTKKMEAKADEDESISTVCMITG